MPVSDSHDPSTTDSDATRLERLFARVEAEVASHADIVRELHALRELASERQRSEAEARAHAERANECLTSFLHALSHDIRTPFVGIDATMQLLEADAERLSDAELRARVVEAARSARSACGFGLGMVGDLLELVRADAGQWTFEPAPTDLLAVASTVREVLLPQARAKGLDITVRLSGLTHDEVARVVTDARRLTQALANVVGNAVKFSGASSSQSSREPANEGVVEIEIARAHAGDASIEIRVRDSGPGLDEASLAQLFEPFRQGARTAARARDGLGLGLAIAQRCAQLLGGSWTAANRTDGRGAVFTLCIPNIVAAGEKHCGGEKRCGGETAPADASNLRILVVDDAEDAARLALHHLRALGHTAVAAASVAAATRLLASDRFDFVLADIELPDGSGLDLLEVELPKDALRPPIVVSSARTEARPEYARAAGVVPKPITREALRSALRSVTVRAGVSPSGSSDLAR